MRSHAEIVRQTAAWTTLTPAVVAEAVAGRGKAPDTVPGFKESAAWVSRRAMSAEARDGRLYIFMPPTEALDDYLELVAVVELTAAELAMPVIMEGYEPPGDPRLTNFPRHPRPRRHRG